MSHEILLVTGSPAQDARARRRVLVEHAAAQVPGTRSWSLAETPTATLAVVETDPQGGSVAFVETRPTNTVVILGASQRAIDAIRPRPEDGFEFGSEAGHVSVTLEGDSVRIITDGTAFVPSYWSECEGEFRFSTHLSSLVSLGVAPEPDQQGVLEYLVMLHPLRERTILNGVQMLPAGGQLLVKQGRPVALVTRRLFVPASEAMSDGDAVRTFRGVWAEVVAGIGGAAATESAALGLSGGLDSRAIAVEAVRQGFRPVAYTYGTRATREGAVAAAVAETLQLEHLLIPVTRERMLPNATSIARLLDGAHSPGEMYELWFADRLRPFADVVVNGLAGGPLWGDDKALGIQTTEGVLSAQTARYESDLAVVRQVLTPELRDGVGEIIRSTLASSMDEWDMTARSDMPIFWKVHNRQFRWGNMLTNGLRRVGIRTEAPFLDSRFLSFAARLTPEQRRNGTLYLRVQREVFGATAHIPRSDDGNSPLHLSHVYWSGDSSYLRQLCALTVRHPVSGIRRGLRRTHNISGAWVRAHTPFASAGNTEEARRSVFASDLWLRTQRHYRERLADFMESAPAPSLLSSGAIEHAIGGLRSGQPRIDALSLTRIATAQFWLADYVRRDQIRRSALADMPTVNNATLP